MLNIIGIVLKFCFLSPLRSLTSNKISREKIRKKHDIEGITIKLILFRYNAGIIQGNVDNNEVMKLPKAPFIRFSDEYDNVKIIENSNKYLIVPVVISKVNIIDIANNVKK